MPVSKKIPLIEKCNMMDPGEKHKQLSASYFLRVVLEFEMLQQIFSAN